MASLNAIEQVFTLLADAGYPAPTAVQLPGRVRAWSLITEHVSDAELMTAAAAWLRQDKYRQWPVPGSLLSMVEELTESAGMNGDQAWAYCLNLISRHGTRWSKPCLTREQAAATEGGFVIHADPDIGAALMAGLGAVGGWRGLGMIQEGDAAARASFRSVWNAGRKSATHRARLGIGQRERLKIGPSDG